MKILHKRRRETRAEAKKKKKKKRSISAQEKSQGRRNPQKNFQGRPYSFSQIRRMLSWGTGALLDRSPQNIIAYAAPKGKEGSEQAGVGMREGNMLNRGDGEAGRSVCRDSADEHLN